MTARRAGMPGLHLAGSEGHRKGFGAPELGTWIGDRCSAIKGPRAYLCTRWKQKSQENKIGQILSVGLVTFVYLSHPAPLYPYDQRASENLNIRAVLESGYFGWADNISDDTLLQPSRLCNARTCVSMFGFGSKPCWEMRFRLVWLCCIGKSIV